VSGLSVFDRKPAAELRRHGEASLPGDDRGEEAAGRVDPGVGPTARRAAVLQALDRRLAELGVHEQVDRGRQLLWCVTRDEPEDSERGRVLLDRSRKRRSARVGEPVCEAGCFLVGLGEAGLVRVLAGEGHKLKCWSEIRDVGRRGDSGADAGPFVRRDLSLAAVDESGASFGVRRLCDLLD